MSQSWIELGAMSPTELTDARLQLHHAAQLASSPARTLLPEAGDHGHTNLGWLGRRQALAGRDLSGDRSLRVALDVARLAIVFVDDSGEALDEPLPLHGRTSKDAWSALARTVERHTDRELPPELEPPPYDLPAHPLTSGAAFVREPRAAFAELARWFDNTHGLLASIADRDEGRPEVRCWPHHFDLATLLTVERGPGGAATKTVGVGLSPGDETRAEPYWYVTPWPYPEDTALPELPGAGYWHTAGFTAAILTGTALVDGAKGDEQRGRVDEFLDGAISAARDVLTR